MRKDIIVFNEADHAAELARDLKFDATVDKETRNSVTSIVKEFQDCFIKEGAKRTILGYEFGIDTGGVQPVCCRKLSNGPYESKVIMEQITQLLRN